MDADKRWACGLSRAMGVAGGFTVAMLTGFSIGGVGVALGAPLGQTSDFATPTISSGPEGIAVGPDGTLKLMGVNGVTIQGLHVGPQTVYLGNVQNVSVIGNEFEGGLAVESPCGCGTGARTR